MTLKILVHVTFNQRVQSGPSSCPNFITDPPVVNYLLECMALLKSFLKKNEIRKIILLYSFDNKYFKTYNDNNDEESFFLPAL